ncbi:MAG TPA: hypothetical protein VMT87_01580 [Vicinamibacteria bacterium]|nr:hypothetical protein [Vicinamibacteria bacterium]
MTSAGGSRRRGIALAALVAAALLAFQAWRARDPRVYTRFELPAFDAYAYVAMAEEPRVFTIAPWGYRVLAPGLTHLVAGGEPTRVLRAFRAVNLGALLAAALLLWLFQRRLGLAPWAALVGTAAFTLSPPVAALLRNPYLTDAVVVALEAAFLLAVEAGAGVPVLVFLAASGALAKESFLLLVPAVYFARRRRDGDARALASTAAALLAAAAVTVLLRWWWTPHLHTDVPAARWDTLLAAAANVRAFAGRQPWAGWLLLAAVAATLLAARRAEGRSLLARFGYVALAALAAPFFNPVVFSAGDVSRLLVHALPVLVPVLVSALPGAWAAPARAAPSRGRIGRPAAIVAAAAALAAPFVLDRYRRADLRGPRDGPLVLAFCRDTLRTARRLQRGEAVTFDPATRQFEWGVSDPGRLHRMRWFLREGWGERAHYGTGAVAMSAPRADLAIPSLDGRDLNLTLHLRAADDAAGTVLVNGHAVGQWRAGLAAQTFFLPAGALFRGDNVATVEVAAGDPRQVRLERFTVAPAGR